MAAPQASSRLELLQARFQQKQLQEKEQKLLQLYDQQQQRAYQVVQRGSPGSNGSNHATTTITSHQHTSVTKSSSSSHATSTSQGGKVRQMFDERRQTTVKGIDRSYPLEPLENKPRKQANGNGVQKNGNLTVSRQSVTVKRVARADVNSNLNGGKPVASYHEEIARESFGPRQHQDDDEFGIENRVARYSNGNHRDETSMEEVVDQDTIERNRMMAKLHLMEYDETLKHRVKNDLESEEFPEDFMVDVPDKLPKQSVAKKLSQAEARLERFKNANAKRGNNVTKSQTIAPKKRSDPIFPAKSTPRGAKDGRRSEEGRKTVGRAVISETGPRFFCKESEMSATTYAIDSNTATRLSSESSREKSSKFCREESEMYAAIEPKAARKLSSESFKSREIQGEYEGPKLSFDEEFKKSDSKTGRKLSPGSSRGRVKRGQSPEFFRKEKSSIDSKTARKLSLRSSIRDEARRNENSTRFKEGGTIESDESEKSAAAIDSTIVEKFSPDFSNVGESRGDVTKFFCQENEKSATTHATDSKSHSSDSPDYMRNTESFLLKIGRRNRKDNINADGQVKRGEAIRKSSSSPEDSKSIKTKSFERLTRERSPRFLNREREKSATTIGFDQEHAACKSPSLIEKDMKKRGYENVGGKWPDFTRKRSNTSPQFFSSDKSATIVMVTPETIRKPGVTGSERKEQNAKKIESKRKPAALDRNETKHSVSRFFSEKTLRNGEQGIEGKKRDSSPSKHARTPSPLAKPQLYRREKATKTDRTRCAIDGSTRRHSSPRRMANSREEFFCYEARSSKRATDVRSKGGKSIERREIGTKSKPSTDDDDDLTVSRLDREGFEHTLRSTKLIRDTMTSDANRVDHSFGASIEAGIEESGKEIGTVESSPKSCTSVEVDTEIQEITMPDQYVKREHCRDACNETKLADSDRSRIEKLFTYSVRKPVKQRRSLLESNVFERSEARRRGEKSSHKDLATSSKLSSKKRSVYDASKREEAKEKDISREQTPSPSQVRKGTTNKTEKYNARESIAKRKTVERGMNREGEDSPRACREDEILKSMELVRRAMRGSSFETASDVGLIEEEQIDITARESAIESGTGKNYERTDSVESALRRFDSIGTETGSIRSVLERSEESIRQTLDRSSSAEESSSRKISKVPSGCRGDLVAGIHEKYLSKARMEEESNIGRMPRSCKRKLFHEFSDSGEETETGSARSRCSLDSVRTVECLWTRPNNKKKTHSVKIAATRLEFGDGRGGDKGEAGETSTGADRSLLSVKRLRSIEDIRRSIEGESKSVIESGTGRSEARRINIDDRGASGERMFLPRRSGNVAAGNKGMGDTSRSAVKCAMRFPRVVKSPSPETMKTAETGNRARRNVPPSPSKSPDTMPRRVSTELKAQDTKSTKRGTPMKGAEPIGNRKTMTTTTSTMSTANTRKSTDVVDGAILENGLHLRDQTAETKYDNDSPTMKKSDAFVIDFDEQRPKENDAPLPRKPFLRKQSTEKQITSTQSLRTPISSVSSTSSGISTQNQTSVYRSRMASRAKTPISSATTYKGSASKNGGAAGGVAANETLVPCKACGRRFAPDRVALHEQICIKTGQKKRKQFDTMMYRVKGTDIEPFVKKGLVKKQMEKSKKPEVKSNWRRKHEDFINAIRSAKQVQAHLAAGGKLSDLPPPPVSDNCDYIQCPHCGRKFNKAAADRHIPKCEHMLHNKPIHSRAPKPKR